MPTPNSKKRPRDEDTGEAAVVEGGDEGKAVTEGSRKKKKKSKEKEKEKKRQTGE